MTEKTKKKEGLFRSIFTAYFILLLHVFLLAGVGLTVVLFKGVYHYLPYILAGLGILVLCVAWVIYRRMRQNTAEIRDIMSMPEFRNRTVEVRLLGGMASFKVNAREPSDQPLLAHHTHDLRPDAHLIESAVDRAERKMLELNTLYEKHLITKEEYEQARQTIIQG